MSGKTQLRSLLIVCLLAMITIILSAAGPIAADTNAFSLNVQVDPPGSGTVSRNPGPPYSENQVVTLTATPAAGFIFDKWVQADDTAWWDAGWDYRVEVTAAAAGYARKDKPAEIALNFTQIWNSLGVNGTLDPNSIRVVEVDANDAVIDDTLPFQFDKASDYNAATKAAGTLVLIMEGNTAAGASRSYHVYFDVTGKGFSAPNVPSQITLTDNIKDEGTHAYSIQTSTGTYYLQKPFGALSSLNDVNGNDWITWSTASGAAGQFRGIPNAGGPTNDGIFHPGLNASTNTSKWEMTPTLTQGPIKVTVNFIETRAATGRSKWEGKFEFYPNYATFTMVHAAISAAKAYDYWFLYEGTPGGLLEQNTDFVVRNDGTQTLVNQSWNGDLVNEEWLYVGDPNVGRSLFLTNHIDDTKTDSFTLDGGKLMTIFGFGRDGGNALLANAIVPRKFTFGLMDETLYDNAKPIIYNAYRDLNVSVGQAQTRAGASLGSQNPVEFTVTGEHTVIAYFKPAQHTLAVNVSPAGTGTVIKTPDKAVYNHGEEVTLAAAPTAQGYSFAGWQGDVTGMTNPITVPVNDDMVVTATFSQSFTVTTNAAPVEGGTVTVDPQKATYEPGETITVTAAANTGYSFVGWTGGLVSSNPVETVIVNSNLVITGNFGQGTFTFNATSGGNGTVDWAPKKAFYAPGELVTVTATPDANYAFLNWSGGAVSTLNPLQLPINSNTTVQANFTLIQFYTVNVSVPGGGGTVTKNPDQPTYGTGTALTLTAVPDLNKRFVAWGGDAAGTDPVLNLTVTGNLTITAAFEDDTDPLTVSVVPPEAGIVSLNPSGGNYMAGTVVTMTAVANPGWTFTSWGGAATGTTNPTSVVVADGGTNVVANFTSLGPVFLNVSITGDGMGTVTKNPDKTEYVWGETVTLTAVPDTGSVFAGWSGDAAGNVNPLAVQMNGNKNIVALFIEPSGPFSDNFNSCGLDAQWEAIDPLGGGEFEVNGRQLLLTVPLGSNHNVWNDGNNAPRIMQDADNVDFEYIVKFDSQVTQNAQMQGLVIEESDGRFARFDFEFNNGTVKAYAATIFDGSARKRISLDINPADAVYLRVVRTGNKWNMTYSGNGTDWIEAGQFNNFALNVTRAGIFAGNVAVGGTPAPAHTAIVDYFQNVEQGPMPEDAPLLNVTIVGGGTVSTNPPLNQLACGQTVNLTAAPGLGWTFGQWSGDATGTSPQVSILLDESKLVTATFIGSPTRYILLPAIIR